MPHYITQPAGYIRLLHATYLSQRKKDMLRVVHYKVMLRVPQGHRNRWDRRSLEIEIEIEIEI